MNSPYHIVDLPASRRATPNLIDLAWVKHCVYSLLEVDVTVARQFIEMHRERTGEGLSFTGYLAFCLAHAVDEDKTVQAYLKGRRQLMMFDDVDVGLPIERQVGGTRVPMGYVIHRANHKTFYQIHQEIRSFQVKTVPPSNGMVRWLRFGLLLPGPLSMLFCALIRAAKRRDPTLMVAMAGTVGVTAVGMFGHGRSGWALTPAAHSLDLIVGGIARKPAMVDDRIEPREILNLTVAFDYDVVDRALAGRFVQRLVEWIECEPDAVA
jgi:pyruvate/2-oxoglutarate dehydrogenase complex dihydrolipoamide acyltransferase (E2) component